MANIKKVVLVSWAVCWLLFLWAMRTYTSVLSNDEIDIRISLLKQMELLLPFVASGVVFGCIFAAF